MIDAKNLKFSLFLGALFCEHFTVVLLKVK